MDLANALGVGRESLLRLGFDASGQPRRLEHDGTSITLYVPHAQEASVTNLYLRERAGAAGVTALLGPSSPTCAASSQALRGHGTWRGIEYRLRLDLAADPCRWLWRLELRNTAATARDLALVYVQDLALSPYGAVRLNEYYVSQYIDHTPLHHPERGFVVASRQNLAAGNRHPWCALGSLRRATGFATDALDIFGLSGRSMALSSALRESFPNRTLQHEHSVIAIADEPITLAPGEWAPAGFFGLYEPDHPAASSAADVAQLAALLSQAAAEPSNVGSSSEVRGATSGTGKARKPAKAPAKARSLYASAPLLNGLPLTEQHLRQHFGPPWRHEERDRGGALLSFFYDANRHVVLERKELEVLRPHGHILRSGTHITPDELALTSTTWMSGVFHSMLTQGHVSINRVISTSHGYLGLLRAHGLRLFVELDGAWWLLNVPSAYEMAPERCRWLYEHPGGRIEVRSGAHAQPGEMSFAVEMVAGAETRCLIALHSAMNGDDGSASGQVAWSAHEDRIILTAAPGSELATRFPQGCFELTRTSGARFEAIGGDELLWDDALPRGEPFLCLRSARSRGVELTLRGRLVPRDDPRSALRLPPGAQLLPSWEASSPGRSELAAPLGRLLEALPWFTHNALVHYLAPRGLEQYSGGGWGTRDVCQGPIELLMSCGRLDAVRDVVLRVMAEQNADGDWPQWFMFFARDRHIRAGDSHGDIVFWPLLALAQYLQASGDASLWDERPLEAAGCEHANLTVGDRVARALRLIERRTIPGTELPRYGHGDWNDSLQPADPALREHLTSAWTTTLKFQTFKSLARALHGIGRAELVQPLEAAATAVLRDFRRWLLPDGVLAGYAHFAPGQPPAYLLHPRDTRTGVRYSSLAMVHALLEDMLEPHEVTLHLELLREHLQGPDGLRLFDRPLSYQGGPQRLFQRAETAAFFGREIGLMYMHAHLRYAQALAHLGYAAEFFRALCLANPILIRELVPSAALRQANCFFSSSDAAFATRYAATAEYEQVRAGTVGLEGGWRVYSSGAGIAVGLIVRRFLGLERETHRVRLDPVIPRALDGLRVRTRLLERDIEIHYEIGPRGCGVTGLALNGEPLAFVREHNPHRPGAACLTLDVLQARLTAGVNSLAIGLA